MGFRGFRGSFWKHVEKIHSRILALASLATGDDEPVSPKAIGGNLFMLFPVGYMPHAKDACTVLEKALSARGEKDF